MTIQRANHHQIKLAIKIYKGVSYEEAITLFIVNHAKQWRESTKGVRYDCIK